MGAEVPIWVEVEVKRKVWVESYGVTSDDATENLINDVGVSVHPTGRTSYSDPEKQGLEVVA